MTRAALRPSPAQGRLLRELRDNAGRQLRVWFGSVEYVSSLAVNDPKWQSGVRAGVHRATAMGCVRMGWIERVREAPSGSYYGRSAADGLGYYELTAAGRESIASLPEEAFVSPRGPAKPSMRGEAARILRAIAERHDRERGWIFIAEAPGGVDAFAINCFASQNHRRVGYEVKVSRSDFMAEMRQPMKTQRSACFCDQFFFACPAHLIKASEVPDPYGLIYINEKGKTRMVKRSSLPKTAPSWDFVGKLLRRVVQLEEVGGSVARA